MTKKQPQVGIILLNHLNFAKHTQECIESLAKMTSQNYHIFIADNGSPDKEEIKLLQNCAKQNPQVHLDLLDDSYGFPKGNNAAIHHALKEGMDYIWVLGNDTAVRADALDDFLQAYNKYQLPKKDTVLSCIITYYANGLIWFNGINDLPLVNFMKAENKNEKPEIYETQELTLKPTRYGNGCCHFFAKEMVAKHGLMDEQYYFYYDDPAFTFNTQNFVIQKALIRHKVSATLGFAGAGRFSPFQAYWNGRNEIIFYFSKKRIPIWEKIIYLVFTMWAIIILYIRDLPSLISYFKGVINGLGYTYFNVSHPFCTRKVHWR